MVSRLGAAPSSTDVICNVFGPNNDNNGWKYKHHLGPTACARNEDLYCRVCITDEGTNRELITAYSWLERCLLSLQIRKSVQLMLPTQNVRGRLCVW